MVVGEDFEGALIDGVRGREAIVGCGFWYVDGEHLGACKALLELIVELSAH